MSAPPFVCEVGFKADPGAEYHAEVLALSPAVYLRTGESAGTNANDETANGNDGTYTGGFTLGAAGALDADSDTAVSFNGTTGYITVPDHATLDFADVFSFGAWVKPAALDSRQVFGKGTGAPGFFFDSGGVLSLSKAGTATICTANFVFQTGVWYHVFATKNGATFKIYVNGVDVTVAVGNQTCTSTADALNIGRTVAGTNFFSGPIDEPVAYPTALTGAQVLALYNAGKPWTDVSSYSLGFASKRGRQKELDGIDAGTYTDRFNNSDRRFDPTHGSSPYSPNVLPMRRIRRRAVHNGVTYPLWAGFVQAWPQTWEGPNVGFSTVNATDAFLPLSKADVGENTTWPREFSGARITRVLDLAGWSAADRSIDAGYSEIAETTFALGAGVTALDHIREVAGAELGTFFVDGAGRAVFHDRHHRKAVSYLTSQATFGDALSGGLPYQHVVLDTDDDRIWNDIQVTAPGGETQRAEDATSQTTYLRRTLARQVPLARDTESADQAAYLLSQYKDPKNRLAGIRITPTTDAEWVQVLSRELGDHITVRRWPQGVGSVITQECSIEAIEHAASPGSFTTTWLLSTPAYTAIDWWILADSTFGVEGTTTKLVY